MNEVSLKGRQPPLHSYVSPFLAFVFRVSVFWFFARLGMASPSSRSLLAAFRDPRVRPPPLRPLRDGLVVLASFTFLLVFVFLSVYLFLLLVFLT